MPDIKTLEGLMPSLGQLMDRAAPETKGASYSDKPIGHFENVQVKLPALTSCRDVEAHSFTTADKKKVEVEAHQELRACVFGQGGYVQRNFFGFEPDDFGEKKKKKTKQKKQISSITVWIKFSESGKKVLLLDIRKAPEGTPAKFELEFSERRPWDIPIPCGGGVRFLIIGKPVANQE